MSACRFCGGPLPSDPDGIVDVYEAVAGTECPACIGESLGVPRTDGRTRGAAYSIEEARLLARRLQKEGGE